MKITFIDQVIRTELSLAQLKLSDLREFVFMSLR